MKAEEDEQTQYMVFSHLGHHLQGLYVVAIGFAKYSVRRQTSPRPNNETNFFFNMLINGWSKSKWTTLYGLFLNCASQNLAFMMLTACKRQIRPY